MTASAQLKRNAGRESQGACRQDELIGGKTPVVNHSDSDWGIGELEVEN
jgi:hypothetical protein